MAPISWPQQQLVQHCQALASIHKDCRQFRWRASMVRHSRSVAFQHLQHCRGWAARVQAAAKQDTQPAGQRSVDCVNTGMDTEGMVSQDEDAGEVCGHMLVAGWWLMKGALFPSERRATGFAVCPWQQALWGTAFAQRQALHLQLS